MVTFHAAALARAISERNTYRALVCAALDTLHDVTLENDRLRRQMTELREEQARYARSIFSE